MGWNKPDEDTRADHFRDSRKHDFDPLPVRLEPAPIPTAMEVALLVKALPNVRTAADLIEQYARTVASAAQVDVVEETYKRVNAVLDGGSLP
jgi:hypothetical protein